MSEVLLEAKDLHIHFFTRDGVVKAVDGVNLKVERGKTLCLVGESGCGKSVTGRSFLNLIRSPGKIVKGELLYHRPLENGGIETIDIAQLDPKGKQIRQIRGNEIAMIFQEPMASISVMHTIGNQIIEMIRLHTSMSKSDARDYAIELLRMVEIPKPERLIDEYPFRLSGGMRQRAMIAMAIACNPTLLVADEPTTALDVTTQAQILELLHKLQDEYGMAVLFITHDLGVVAEIADDVAVMYLGCIVERSDVRTIFHNPKHPYTRALLESIPRIGSERSQLNPIEGMVPSPYHRPKGCTFHPRCRERMETCNHIVPETTQINERHVVRCLLHEPEALTQDEVI